MARVKIPYYRIKRGNGFWEPPAAWRALGALALACGPDGPAAWTKAREQLDFWRARAKRTKTAPEPQAPPGSLKEAFLRYRKTGEWTAKAPRTREEWERAWSRIGPIFGDHAPMAARLEQLSAFRALVEREVSTREAHRCLKIWRALWRVAAAQGYCEAGADPSQGVRNKEPPRRQAVWTDAEARKLVKTAWRAGYRGLAALIALAWDSSLSPVDARRLTPAQRARDGQGDVFILARAKTGRAAAATLTRRASYVLDAYLASLGVEIAPSAPIFRHRHGAPYSKDTLGDDFRDVRKLAFGEAETRTLADFRRSGAIEALRGGATPEGISAKLANDFATNANLQRTYAPVDLAKVRQVDAARKKGRT